MRDDKKENAKELVSYGAQLAGAATGSLIGFFTGGPVGAIAGAVAGELIPIAIEFTQRQLSQREKVRVGAGLAFAYDKISQYRQEGHIPRKDSFFETDISGRRASAEILEGVLLKCKNEHEEKKTRFIGSIYANVAFMPHISASTANYLLHIAERFTYRQLCTIALIQRADEINKRTAWGHLFSRQSADASFMAEIRELGGFVDGIGNTAEAPSLEELGQICYETMSLQDIPVVDLLEIAALIPI